MRHQLFASTECDGEWLVHCPHCNFDYSSHVGVLEFRRLDEAGDCVEDGQTYMSAPGRSDWVPTSQNPSPRRGGVVIVFEGECGHVWELLLSQHKGQTFINVGRIYDREELLKPNLATMPYAEYLKTEHWQQQREAAKERAGHRCQLCNSGERLEVHHRTYERRGAEEPGDLIVLCHGCHEKFHDVLDGKATRMPARK